MDKNIILLASKTTILNNARTSFLFPMNTRRILSSIATATICFSMMQPAFASSASTDEVLAELKTFDPSTMCAGREGKNLGKCIGDVIKRISTLRFEFTQAEKRERNAWYQEHGQLGVSAEYSKLLQEYLAGVKIKRTEFTTVQRDLEKVFFAARKTVLDNAESGTGSYTRAVTGADLEAAKAKCAKQSNNGGLRICLSQQLRLLNPKTKLLNISPAGIRNTK